MRTLRLVPDGTTIQFMRGRFAGLITSAVLSTISVILFFYPGFEPWGRFPWRGRGRAARPAGAVGRYDPGSFCAARFWRPASTRIRFSPRCSRSLRQQDATARRAADARRARRRSAPQGRGPAGGGGRREGEWRAFSQWPARNRAGARCGAHLHLVPLRVAVRRRCSRYFDPRRYEDGRLFGRYANRIRPEFCGSTVDPDRLFRQSGRLRPYSREPWQVSNDAAAGAHRSQHHSDPRPHGRDVVDGNTLDPASCVDRRRGYARLRSRDYLRLYRGHLIVN